MNQDHNTLVAADWLMRHLNDPQVVVFDASTAKAGASPSSACCIPGARHFDFDQTICDHSSNLPHMLPSAAEFEIAVRKLGVHRHSQIVVYDQQGIFTSPRVWWMFRAMGHQRVAVLDGGLPSWQKAGYPVETEYNLNCKTGDFVSDFQPSRLFSAAEVLRAIADDRVQIIDARSAGRFAGLEPEPRPGLRLGHIPTSVNLPFTQVLRQGQMVALAELAEQFAPLISATDQQLVFSCGSGITACILALAAERYGHKNISVYDGSWSEWGLGSDLPISL